MVQINGERQALAEKSWRTIWPAPDTISGAWLWSETARSSPGTGMVKPCSRTATAWRSSALWGAADMIPTRAEMERALAGRQGAELTARFAAAAVAVCGLGGLGSHIANFLARAGVGR